MFFFVILLMVAAVSWHLQNPFGGFQHVEKEACSPSFETRKPTANTSRKEKACDPLQHASQANLEGTLITGIHLLQLDGTRTQWSMDAPSAQDEGEERIVIHKPSLTIYKKDGQIVSVTSTKGSIDHRSRTIVFTGKVVATNGGQHLSTDILRFDPNERILYTERAFLLVSDHIRLEGVGLTLYQETKKLLVPHQVKVQIQSQAVSKQERQMTQNRWTTQHKPKNKRTHHKIQPYMSTQKEMFQPWNT